MFKLSSHVQEDISRDEVREVLTGTDWAGGCICRSAAPDAKVQQSAGTQKGRAKSGGKEKKAPALSTEQEQV